MAKKRRRKKRKRPQMKVEKRLVVDSFDLKAGRRLAGKFEIVACLGTGWEGEVYKIRELSTGIERAAKFFFPQRNPNNRTLTWYAKKLHTRRESFSAATPFRFWSRSSSRANC
jgi:hypothetical protein